MRLQVFNHLIRFWQSFPRRPCATSCILNLFLEVSLIFYVPLGGSTG